MQARARAHYINVERSMTFPRLLIQREARRVNASEALILINARRKNIIADMRDTDVKRQR